MPLSPSVSGPLDCGTLVGGNSPKWVFEKPPIGSRDFLLVAKEKTRVLTQGGESLFFKKDLLMSRSFSSSTISDYEVFASPLRPQFSSSPTITSSNPLVLSNPVGGVCAGVSEGVATIVASQSGSVSTSAVYVSLKQSVGVESFVSLASGSAAAAASAEVDGRIASADPASSKAIFSTANHSLGSYLRNSGCWASGIDLTCASPWNSIGGQQRAGTLISPRHVLFAAHYPLSGGCSIRFVDNSNNVVTRTVTAVAVHPNYSPYFPDIGVGVLDSAVPSSVSFAKVLPQNWANYLPSLADGIARIPAVVLDQQDNAIVADVASASGSLFLLSYPTDQRRLLFSEQIVTGDSGNPVFVVIGGQAAIIGTLTFGGPGSGTLVSGQMQSINSMMSSLGGGYQLTTVDLTSFPSY